MQFISTTSALAALAALSAALPSPEPATTRGRPPLPMDLAPGIHHWALDDFGNPNITRVGDLDRTRRVQVRDPTVLEKRVNTWTGCEGYSFTSTQKDHLSSAWASLLSWAAAAGTGASPWIDGDYIASEDSGVYAYLCEWGSGNHATTQEINEAEAMVSIYCPGGAGMHQWNEWKKGIGAAALGQTWCNGQ